MYMGAWRRVLHRIGHDVRQDLLEPFGVPVNPHRFGVDVDLPIQLCVTDKGGEALAYGLGHVEWLPIEADLSGDEALDVEQIVDQMCDMAGPTRKHAVPGARWSAPGVTQLER